MNQHYIQNHIAALTSTKILYRVFGVSAIILFAIYVGLVTKTTFVIVSTKGITENVLKIQSRIALANAEYFEGINALENDMTARASFSDPKSVSFVSHVSGLAQAPYRILLSYDNR